MHLPTTADLAALRAHPGFRGAVERCVAADLAGYHNASLIERWMVSDIGRSSLSGAAFALDALGLLTVGSLMGSPPVARSEVSRGRARLYLERAVANGLIVAEPAGAPLRAGVRLAPTRRFRAVMGAAFLNPMTAASALAPQIAPAVARASDEGFVRRASGWAGRIVTAVPGLFPLDRPARLFQGRDGGSRMLADLIARQRPGRARLLDVCEVSRSALARASHCSRAHVIRLLSDGRAMGLLSLDGNTLTVTPRLSDDVETYIAGVFAVAIAAAQAALAEG